MTALRCLGAFGRVPRTDKPEVQALYPEEARYHPQKMRHAVAVDVLGWAMPLEHRAASTVVDPIVGVGTTYMAANELGFQRVIGQDHWAWLVEAVWADLPNGPTERQFTQGDSTWQRKCEAASGDLLFFSPPFPMSHDPGSAEMQDLMRATKGMRAGGDVPGQKAWTTKAGFVDKLTDILRTWAPAMKPWSMVVIHIKNMVRDAREVRVDEWVAEAMRAARLQVVGYASLPLAYRSLFQEMHRHPLRKVVKAEIVEETNKQGRVVRRRKETLNCAPEAHVRFVPLSHHPTKRGRCRVCPPLDRHEVREERVVVGEVVP